LADKIRGKVARILNSRELAINIGSKHGVHVGMYFDVLDPKGEEIRDPDTGEVIGLIDRPKVRVQITNAQEGLSIASTFRRKPVNVGGRGLMTGNSLADLFQPPKIVNKYETLKTDEKTWEDINESESYVKTGDPVVQVVNEIDVGQNEG